MDVSPSRREQRSSILLKGLGAGLTQWDDLKSWQVRQEALFIQSTPTKGQGNGRSSSPDSQNGQTFGANSISLLMQTRNFSLENRSNVIENAEEADGQQEMRQPVSAITNGAHHDLSIIPEVDEDTRTTVDVASSDEETTPTPSPKIQKLPLSIPPLKVQTRLEMQRAPPPESRQAKPPVNQEPQKAPVNKKPTRPFLRRGQGLVRFNLRPEDTLKPYQNGTKNPPRIIKPPQKPSRPSKKQPEDCPIALSTLKLKRDPPKISQPEVDRVRANAGFSTWSHLLAQDENLEDEEDNTVAGLVGVRRMKDNPVRPMLLGSPKRTGTLRDGRGVFEDDEESLAAYVALEQHVGDTSFCSTSSKVDRLVAKSARVNLPNSPRRQNLLQSREEHKSSFGRVEQAQARKNPVQEETLSDWEAEEEELKRKKAAHLTTGRINVVPKSSYRRVEDENQKNPVQGETFSDWEAEEEELKRKKMAHLTTGRINRQVDDDDSLSESDSETEEESDCSEEEDTMFSAAPQNPVKITDFAPINNPCDTSTASIDLVIENINRKVEEHLSRLCVEIETLQKSNSSAKNQVKSMKKQVRKLEQKLATEHLAYERKLAEQREDSAKVLAEEKAKVAKEKANFERFCREQKKKEASAVLIEQVERLRTDMVAKEEKWRAERAKARGLECNLRIQITNLRQENEKLKNENSKLKREKETAINAAKAKNVSNTKVINAIAQHLSKAKPQVTVTKEKNAPSGKLSANKTAVESNGASTNKMEAPIPASRQPTIGVFPTAGTALPKDDEWLSSDEEIDLGPKTPEKFEEELKKAISNGPVGGIEDCVPAKAGSLTESGIAETEARYNALFENQDIGDFQRAKRTNSDLENNVIVHADGSVERKKSSGGSVLTLPDGTQKRKGKNGSVMTVPPSGWPILVTYYNGDKLERFEDGTVRYFYAKTQTWQITHPDGREELQLPNGVGGDKRGEGPLTVTIPAETKAHRESLNESATFNTPETVVLLPNGDQEIRTKDYVERRFQDGTVRYLYKDGMQKTIYKSGRVRVKDKDGKLLLDSVNCERR